jgi:hypothetical protein
MSSVPMDFHSPFPTFGVEGDLLKEEPPALADTSIRELFSVESCCGPEPIETVLVDTAGDTAPVVVGVTVLEPVGHHEVERLVCHRSAHRMLADEGPLGAAPAVPTGVLAAAAARATARRTTETRRRDMPPPR